MRDDELLQSLLLRWKEARDAGRDVSAADICGDRHDLIGELQRRIDHLRDVGWVNALAGTDTTPLPITSDRLAAGMEPVPGYRLKHRLGKGGFGEVWAATGPGGFPVAVKLIDRSAAPVEARALEVMKGIGHPHLLPLFGAWEVGSWLVVAMELAESSVQDRWEAARTAGHSGLPRDEARRIIADAAAGLDALNAPPHAIQHRDVKPQNLLLVGGRVKVADFGLAREVAGSMTGHSGAMTPAFAAPEFFAGQTARTSDQYCLAVTYCLLRGGRLPFTGNPAAIMRGHLHGRPDLSMLPATERPIVARALAKNPADRWPDCAAFAAAVSTVPAPEYPEPVVSKTPRRRWPVAVAVLSLAAGLAVWLGMPRSSLRESDVAQSSDAAGVVEDGSEVLPMPGLVDAAFVFDGKGRIETPLKRFTPVTIEGWFKPDYRDSDPAQQVLIDSSIPGKGGIGLGLIYTGTPALLSFKLITPPSMTGGSANNFQFGPPGQWYHLAATFGKDSGRLFVNGQEVPLFGNFFFPDPAKDGTTFVLGTSSDVRSGQGFVGRVRAVRISHGERYRGTFAPPRVLAADANAALVYDATVVDQQMVRDLSGQGHDGKMIAVTLDTDPLPEVVEPKQVSPSEDTGPPAFVFDSTGQIETPVKPELPFTVESWLKIDSAVEEKGGGLVFACPANPNSGVGLRFNLMGGDLYQSVISLPDRQGWNGPFSMDPPFLANRWQHVAVIYGKTWLRLFQDGNEVPVVPFPKGYKLKDLSKLGPLIIGGPLRGPQSGFHGRIRSLRVSQGEKYSAKFQPPKEFMPEPDTVALFDAAAVDGSKAIDRSGKKNDGLIKGVTISGGKKP